jgi:hypothetical protein
VFSAALSPATRRRAVANAVGVERWPAGGEHCADRQLLGRHSHHLRHQRQRQDHRSGRR